MAGASIRRFCKLQIPRQRRGNTPKVTWLACKLARGPGHFGLRGCALLSSATFVQGGFSLGSKISVF